MQAQEVKAVQSFGIRENGAFQIHNSCSNQSSASSTKEAIPIRFIVGYIFPSEIILDFMIFLPVGSERRVGHEAAERN